jgi:hypothetical protein
LLAARQPRPDPAQPAGRRPARCCNPSLACWLQALRDYGVLGKAMLQAALRAWQQQASAHPGGGGGSLQA